MTAQSDARTYFELCLKGIPANQRDHVESYINLMIDIEGPLEMLKLDWEAVRRDFDLHLEIIQNEGEDFFKKQVRESSTDNLLNMLPGNVIVVDFPEQEKSYLESIASSFVCDICGERFPESKGYLSRPKGLGTAEQASLHDQGCIDKYHLIMEPEEKDRRA